MTDDERRKLVSTETSLAMGEEPRLPSSIAGLENFSLTKPSAPEREGPVPDADSFFNLPDNDGDHDEEDGGERQVDDHHAAGVPLDDLRPRQPETLE